MFCVFPSKVYCTENLIPAQTEMVPREVMPSTDFHTQNGTVPKIASPIHTMQLHILSDLMVVWRARPMKTALPT